MYAAKPDAEQMAMFGFRPEDFDDETSLWACNLDSFVVFESMGTQWRISHSGATGLDYGVLPTVIDLSGVETNKQTLFGDIRIMESEALDTMADNKD